MDEAWEVGRGHITEGLLWHVEGFGLHPIGRKDFKQGSK